jgi:outer membrane protein assembly factor BamE
MGVSGALAWWADKGQPLQWCDHIALVLFMLDTSCRRAFFSLVAMAVLACAGCTSLNGAGSKVAQVVKPYRMDVIQGNVVTREQLAVLRPGMQRTQVRDVLGSSLLISVFHANRWDYVFTLKRPGAEPQNRRVTVFFNNDVLERVEADELPSESEFVATLKSPERSGPLPSMEASAEGLGKFPAVNRSAPDAAAALPLPESYPPLEPAAK